MVLTIANCRRPTRTTTSLRVSLADTLVKTPGANAVGRSLIEPNLNKRHLAAWSFDPHRHGPDAATSLCSNPPPLRPSRDPRRLSSNRIRLIISAGNKPLAGCQRDSSGTTRGLLTPFTPTHSLPSQLTMAPGWTRDSTAAPRVGFALIAREVIYLNS